MKFTEIEINTPPYYPRPMSLAEILEEIPKLTFAERQELVRAAIAADEKISENEANILDERIETFRQNPRAGIPLDRLRSFIHEHLER